MSLLGYFNNPDKKNKFYEHELRGKYSKLKDRANTLYRAGKIPEKVLELGQKFRPSAEEASNIFFEMVNIELIKNPHIKDHTSGMFALATGAYNNAIITYAGEKEFIKRILWPDEFGVKEEDILVIPQARPYYICLGAQVGNKLGKVMMDDFAQFLKKHIENLDVHFIGQKNNDYSAAMYFYNEHGHTSGVHCMTYELKTRTKPH